MRSVRMLKRKRIFEDMVGSNENSTGPDVHCKIWEKGKAVNPQHFLQGRS
jgi:hypothetical protein